MPSLALLPAQVLVGAGSARGASVDGPVFAVDSGAAVVGSAGVAVPPPAAGSAVVVVSAAVFVLSAAAVVVAAFRAAGRS